MAVGERSENSTITTGGLVSEEAGGLFELLPRGWRREVAEELGAKSGAYGGILK